MVDDRLRAPAGVVLAALVLAVMTFFGLLFAGLSAFALFVVHSPLIPRIPVVRFSVAGLDALVLALVILAVCTIIGLFRLRVWARYSVVLLGLLDFLVFGLLTAGVLIGRVKSGLASMPIPNNPHVTVGGLLLGLAAANAVLALIGLWWMVYFSLPSVRVAFAEAEAGLTA